MLFLFHLAQPNRMAIKAWSNGFSPAPGGVKIARANRARTPQKAIMAACRSLR
jgi:hypothetical protein